MRHLAPLLLLLAAVVGYLLLDEEVAPVPPEAAPALPTMPAFEQLEVSAVPPPSPPPEPLAAAQPVVRPRYSLCPDEDGAPVSPSRPPLASLLSLQASELMDQVRSTFRSGRGSRELRKGLTDFLADQDEAAIARLAAAPDRDNDGFDYAAAATIVMAMQALNRGDHPLTHRLAQRAVELSPEDPAVHVLGALSARAEGATAQERQHLERAFALSPDEPALAVAVGEARANTSDLKGAEQALDNYLESFPDDVAAGQLRERVKLQSRLLRGMDTLSGGGITILYPESHVPHRVANRLHGELQAALSDAAELTGLPRREDLHVVVYHDRSDLIASTCVPNWTEGVFDGTLRLHAAAVMDPERRLRVVRHEVLHAQLRRSPLPAPHWFHEGVAQYFAKEQGAGHLSSYRFMLRNHTFIPFDSMQGSFLVFDAGDDARLAYHQSLAMVQMMIAERGANAIAEAIAYLQRDGDPGALWPHMMGRHGDGPHLLSHLRTTVQRMP